MHDYESEFNKLVVIEQRLLSARSELTAAVRRLGGHGQLAEGIRAVADELDDTIALTRRTKRIMLWEWQKTGAEQPAA